jgi:hypothetical protein
VLLLNDSLILSPLPHQTLSRILKQDNKDKTVSKQPLHHLPDPCPIAMTSILPTNVNESNCRYCSVVSKANGADPIGTASSVNEWLFVEVPRPWTKHLWTEKPDYQPLLQQVEALAKQPSRYFKTQLLAIAPDKKKSQSHTIRIFYYAKPAALLFSHYTKQEYLVPLKLAVALIHALLDQAGNLDSFHSYRQATDHIRDLFICTHTHYDIACGRFGTPLYQQLQQQYVPASQGTLRVWQTNHFGGHQFAPTLIDFPLGQFWGHLEPEMLDTLIYRQGSAADLRSYYRGWAGLGKFEQIAEREIWQQEGWEWLTYAKAGCIIAWDEKNFWRWLARRILQWLPFAKIQRLLNGWQQAASWAIVEIQFQRLDGTRAVYSATVKAVDRVEAKLKSGQQVPLTTVLQYSVSNLRQL